jgi:hypothetical protein
MAAETIDTGSEINWWTERVQLSSTANNLREIILPKWAKKCVLTFKSSDGSTNIDGWVSQSGTDETAVDLDNSFPVGAGEKYLLVFGKLNKNTSIYCACGTSNAYAHINLEANGDG